YANPARTLSHAAGLVRHRVGPPPQRSDPTRQPPWTWHGRVYVCWRVHTVFASVEPSAERRRKRGAQRLVSAGHLAIVTGPDGLAEGEIAIVRRSPQAAKPQSRDLAFFWRTRIFGQPAKCEVAHTSLPIRPSKVRSRVTSIWRPWRGRRGTETRT